MRRLGLLILLVAASVPGGSSAPERDARSSASNSAQSSGGSQTAAQMKDFQFAPAVISVKAGDAITWTNNDSFTHNVAVDRGPEIFVTTELKPGETAHITFTKPGSYHYFCEWHPFMQGSIEVAPSGNAPPVLPGPH